MLRSVVRQASFACAAGGVFLPWLIVAGTKRNGLSSAELLMSLADARGPTGFRVTGALWYAGAALVLVGWALATLATTQRHRLWGRLCLGLSFLAWLGFVVWAARDDRHSATGHRPDSRIGRLRGAPRLGRPAQESASGERGEALLAGQRV